MQTLHSSMKMKPTGPQETVMRCWDWNLTSLAISRNPVHKWLEQSQRAASLTYSCPWKPSSCWIVSISTSMNSLNMSFYVMPKLTLANRTIKLSDLKMLLWVEELLVSMLFKDLLFPPVCYKQAPSVRPTTRNRCCVGGTLDYCCSGRSISEMPGS